MEPDTVGLWCNGNTTDFDSVVSGSNPDRPANFISLKRYRVAYTVWGRVV